MACIAPQMNEIPRATNSVERLISSSRIKRVNASLRSAGTDEPAPVGASDPFCCESVTGVISNWTCRWSGGFVNKSSGYFVRRALRLVAAKSPFMDTSLEMMTISLQPARSGKAVLLNESWLTSCEGSAASNIQLSRRVGKPPTPTGNSTEEEVRFKADDLLLRSRFRSGRRTAHFCA